MRDDGHLIVANAGHPSAYVDGREFPVEAGLPLGIVPDATYEETAALRLQFIRMVHPAD